MNFISNYKRNPLVQNPSAMTINPLWAVTLHLQGPHGFAGDSPGHDAPLLSQTPQLDGAVTAARQHLRTVPVHHQRLDIVSVT